MTPGYVVGADFMKQLAGWYSAPALSCSMFNEKNKLVPCDPPQFECLHIERINATEARVKMSSVQTNAHNCEVSGIAKLTNGELRIVDPPYFEGFGVEKGQGARIRVTKNELVFDLLKEPRSTDPFCGSRASIRGVTFERKTRSGIPKPECAVLK